MERLLKAIELTKNGKFDEAEKIYKELVKQDIPEAYNNLGNIYRKKGLIARAIECYKKAIEIKPDFAECYFNLGCAYMEIENYSLAIFSLEKAEKLGLKNFDLDVQLSLCYLAVGNKRKAKEKMKDEKVKTEVLKYIEEG
ncbi:tetratricopeptide repeat protein [Thermosipho melanesiensis]|uniref:TPR repeat-containing protein n=1 Tax=Thermosipho melanesiensis (strain DSM 12029 / CIP 104789 / BI429) TaxID=391009 RepID=A6LL71_THEM4|nr:tetratricopeptide repeat protein [Thermosipho melanesiensis]ABR30672.1 TPR repeat-containing protein [Thermosipho melanesiensis BI429]